MDRELPFTLALPWLLVSGLLLGGDAALGQEPERAAYRAVELELPADVLASALAVDGDGTLYVGSAEGRILRVRRPDARGARVEWSVFARTFDHPCGLLARTAG